MKKKVYVFLCFQVCNFRPFLPQPTRNGWAWSCHCFFGFFLGSVFSWVCSRVRWDGQRKNNSHSFSLSPSCSTRKAVPQLDRHHTSWHLITHTSSEQVKVYGSVKAISTQLSWTFLSLPSQIWVFFIFPQSRNSVWLQWKGLQKTKFYLLLTNPSLSCNVQAEQRPVLLKQTQTVCWLTWVCLPPSTLTELQNTQSSWTIFHS